jgi:hypothetical protein
MCILEREREHIGSIWSRVTCLALPLATAQSLERRGPGDSRSLRLLTVAIRNKQHKQINKQYTKQCVTTKKIVPKDVSGRRSICRCFGSTISCVCRTPSPRFPIRWGFGFDRFPLRFRLGTATPSSVCYPTWGRR